jgi:hypothetical protein
MTEHAAKPFLRPPWKPAIVQPLDRLENRFREVVKGGKDFVLFSHGTCAVVEAGMPEAVAYEAAKTILERTVHQHVDVRPTELTGGDILIRYNQPAANLVLDDIARANLLQIDAKHMSALVPEEVLIMPAGPNKFDTFAKRVLFGRCYLFMDAETLEVDRVVRAYG